jgi:3-dehydroquinate dehydratase II
MRIAIINGPNLNLLGEREPTIYGNTGLSSLNSALKDEFSEFELIFYQSNVEGELVNYIQSLKGKVENILINAAAYTHTSIAIVDALKAVSIPFIEIHISNVHAREAFRQKSFLTPYAIGVISGFGVQSYSLALTFLRSQIVRANTMD